jgi:hypothetical protein
MRERIRRRAAKVVYRAAGCLARVRTPQRFCVVQQPGAAGRDEIGKPRWHWVSCGVSVSLLVWAERLDWDHFGRWALDHDGCEAVRCAVCGGIRCDSTDLMAGFGDDAAGPYSWGGPPPEGGIPVSDGSAQ